MSGLNDPPSGDFLALEPKRRLKWEMDSKGRAVLLRPKFGSGRLGRILLNWFGPSHYRIRLDEVGTAVWVCLDGETPLVAVASELKRKFGSQVEPAEERLQMFVDDMIRKKLIRVD